MKFFNLNKIKAQKFHKLGQSLSDAGKDLEALNAYLKATVLDPSKSESFYNIGLIYKYLGEWNQSLKYNTKAYELDPEDEAARWNIAIAATALRRWSIARNAWKDDDIPLDGESGPIKMNFGMTPICLNPDTSGEVVWATRIDPVRAIIDSVPYKESGFKYRDVVLHDGVAVGYRKVGEIEYPVFNVLELFEQSRFSTEVASVSICSGQDLEKLEAIFSRTQSRFEDWTANIRAICRQCSEGRPHNHHDNELGNQWESERTLGIAVNKGDNFLKLFEEWQLVSEGKLLEVYE